MRKISSPSGNRSPDRPARSVVLIPTELSQPNLTGVRKINDEKLHNLHCWPSIVTAIRVEETADDVLQNGEMRSSNEKLTTKHWRKRNIGRSRHL